jgi:glycogen debranching enzyme
MTMNDNPPVSRPERDAGGRQRSLRERDTYYILVRTPHVDEQKHVLKHGETFGVFDHYGDIMPIGLGEHGLFHEGTRYLSTFVLRLARERPLFLSSTIKEDNVLFTVDLTNPDVHKNGRVAIPRGTLHIARSRFLHDGVCYERIRLRNFGLVPITFSFSLEFAADFADIFEVRGMKRKRRGRQLPVEFEEGRTLGFRYEGLDGLVRRTLVQCSPAPSEIVECTVHFDVALEPKAERFYEIVVQCNNGETPVITATEAFEGTFRRSTREQKGAQAGATDIMTSNEQFNAWVKRATADLRMMLTDTPGGPYPYAGVPWYNTAFGRDGLLTGLQSLWLAPEITRGVLAHLASMQAQTLDDARDAEPGKILHETRKGEMATLGEIPFGCYYGSVDSTPLFLMLAGEYFERTANRAFIESIWPNLEAALVWIDQYGDIDGDGFVEYARRAAKGLLHQGWKDSQDPIFHADGSLAASPIALCEVQGYTYAAKLQAAKLAQMLGKGDLAFHLERSAQELRNKFNDVFWNEAIGTYIIALDGAKRPCEVRTSNAGHALLTGIASPERARRTAEALFSEDSFSGWGIRTVSTLEHRYNPMSYHNGSVWPHDNALIAMGLARYGLKKMALKILTGLFDASTFFDLYRLPELFCGFSRRSGEGPTRYPVACSPQAWAAVSVFGVLQACVGLTVDGIKRQVRFVRPQLPEFLKEVVINNLTVGEGAIDLSLQRYGRDVSVNVLRREGEIEVFVVK